MASGFLEELAGAWGDGPTLTASGAASCLPITAHYTFPPNSINVGGRLWIKAFGRISCAATTPGTARFDIRMGSTVVFDTGPMNLNTTAQTTTPWWLDIEMRIRASSTNPTATPCAIMGFSNFLSAAVVGSPAVASGGNGEFISSVSGGPGTAPAVGNSFDNTIANTLDCFFTQTVGTGSLTVHGFSLMHVAPAQI